MIEVIQIAMAFIVAIGILVTVHEFGHFWVARKLGVEVIRFSVGFGKPLLKRYDRQGTEYVIAAIPLGGYVRMLGENDDEITEGNKHRAFSHKPLKVRTAIVLAGPMFNFIFAIFTLWILYAVGLPGQKAVIGDIAPDSLAAQAGMKGNEQILQINNELTPTWSVANIAMLEAVVAGNRVEVDTQSLDEGYSRHYVILINDSTPLLDDKGVIHNLGMSPWRPPVWIGEVTEGGPAYQAGLQKGDKVLQADNKKISNWGEWVEYIRARPGIPIQVVVLREDQQISVSVTPDLNITEEGQRYGLIGVTNHVPDFIRNQHMAEVRYGVVDSLGHSLVETWDLSGLMLVILGKMVVGEASHKNISGPVKIAQFAGISASLGWEFFVRLLAVLSISLGVLNLLPIPMLDGGHLLYYVIEFVRGVPLSEQAQGVGQQVGITFLVLLMGLALYNDFTSLFG